MATNITLPRSGGTTTIKYNLNCDVSTVTFSNSAPNWLSVSSDVNNRTFTLSANRNPSYTNERTATLTPSINGTPVIYWKSGEYNRAHGFQIRPIKIA